MLRDRKVSQQAILDRVNRMLQEEGQEPISKSSLSRFATKWEEAGARMRASREAADRWIAQLGSVPGGKLGEFVIESVRTLASEVVRDMQSGELDPDKLPETVKMLKDLALIAQRSESASSINVKREAAVRKQALEDAANAVEEAAVQKGMNAEDAAFWRLKVLGVQ
jgi:hypothetical protein